MRKAVYIFIVLVCLLPTLRAQVGNVLPKRVIFKVDPGSAAFNEFRVMVDHRWKIERRERVKDRLRVLGGRFIYYSPSVNYRTILNSSSIHPTGRDIGMERQLAFILRAGLKHVLFNDYEPEGFFIMTGAAWRIRKTKYFDQDLNFFDRVFTQSAGLTGAAGYQWMFGPKKNIVFALSGGVEYFLNFYDQGYNKNSFDRTWYQTPFIDELRVFASAEVGFGLGQIHRHW